MYRNINAAPLGNILYTTTVYKMKLADIKDSLAAAVSNKKFLIVLLITVCFILAAVYTYKKYVTPRINPDYVTNNEYSQGVSAKGPADLYFFYTAWCPHCKIAKPVWAELKKKVEDGPPIKGIKVNFIEVDCDKDTATADTFNVKGYPTIKLVKGNQIIEYDAKPNVDTLMEFLQTSL